MNRIPWTREELQALIPKLEKQLDDIEAEQEEEVKPLPPMTKAECREMFFRISDLSAQRALTQREVFIHDQLLAVYEQAIMAEMLGKKGRYYVIPEDQINELAKQ